MKISECNPKHLGHFVCDVFHDDLEIELYFDYIFTKEKKVLFRWMFSNKVIDISFDEMKERFKTVQELTLYLLMEYRKKS